MPPSDEPPFPPPPAGGLDEHPREKAKMQAEAGDQARMIYSAGENVCNGKDSGMNQQKAELVNDDRKVIT
jgi:hypothetical protein